MCLYSFVAIFDALLYIDADCQQYRQVSFNVTVTFSKAHLQKHQWDGSPFSVMCCD